MGNSNEELAMREEEGDSERGKEPIGSNRKRYSLVEGVVLAVLVAVLSFLGSATATYLSDARGTKQWERESTLAWQQQILQERISVVERTVLAINNRDSIQQLMDMIGAISAELTVAILDRQPGSEITVTTSDMLPGLEQRLRVNEMSREFAVALSLCAVYFGPKTLDAVAFFSDSARSWWELDEDAFTHLSDALWSELTYGFD